MRAFKTELDLNNKQRTAFVRHAGTARFAYHWGLARVQAAFANGEKSPTAIDLQRKLNALKKTALPWGGTKSRSARPRRRCGTWTRPLPTSFAG